LRAQRVDEKYKTFTENFESRPPPGDPPALLVKYTVGLAKYPFCWKMDVLRKKSLKIGN